MRKHFIFKRLGFIMAVSVLLSGTLKDGTVKAIGDMCIDGPNIDIFDITDA